MNHFISNQLKYISMTAKPKGYDAALTLRIPPELKEQCSAEARKTGVTTNEWIKRTLEKAIASGFADDLVSDEELNAWYEQEFIIPEKTGELEKPSREEFVELAVTQLLGTYRCKNCKTLNTGDAKFCCGCGEEISWEHPDQEVAEWITAGFRKKHLKDKAGVRYITSTPALHLRTGRFQILEQKEGNTGGYSVVKEIDPEEIRISRIILESRKKQEEK